MTAELIGRARAGDEAAFRALVAPHERELLVHCYRMLGSRHDAEDALQEVLLAAWQGLAGFEGRASVRTWLYRIATTRCLNARRARSRRVPAAAGPSVPPPEPTRLGEVTWLEAFPDELLTGLPDTAPGPEARYQAREAISLAFVTAVQLLPPRQRAVLLLRDVLGFRAREAAGILGVTEESVTSALKRARAVLRDAAPPGADTPAPGSAAEKDLAERLTAAYERGDVPAIVALFSEDAWLRMPPMPLEYQGRELIGLFLRTVAFRPGRAYRLSPTRANGQLSFESRQVGAAGPDSLFVLTLAAGPAGRAQITAMTRFPVGLSHARLSHARLSHRARTAHRRAGNHGRSAARGVP